MDEKQLLAFENEFIYLKNKKRPLEEIKHLLREVDIETIKNWEAKYNEAKSQLSPSLKSFPIQKSEDGAYKSFINFPLLETMKFELSQIIGAFSEEYPSLNKLQLDAQKHLKTLNLLKQINVNKVNEFGTPDNQYIYHPKVQQTPELAERLQQAFSFYHIYLISQKLLIEEPSNNLLQFSHPPLDYCIKQIAIQNYQGIKNLHLKDLPVDAQWIFITGENGYGKTTLLQAIVIGLYGFKDGNLILIDVDDCEIALDFLAEGKKKLNNLNKNFKRFSNFAAYGPVRLNRTSPNENTIHEKSTPTYNLFHSDGLLLNIDYELKKWYWKKDNRYQQVRQLFIELIPMIQDIYFEDTDGQEQILYIEIDDTGNAYPPLPFTKLASGYRSIISMVGDMLLRLSRQQPNVQNIKELGGIIIIDEIDIHFHPKWQRELPTLLSGAFPKVQFIVSTHSLVPILGAPKNTVFLKLNRTEEAGITVERIPIDISNLLPNTLLSSPLFDLENITSINNNIADLRHEVNV